MGQQHFVILARQPSGEEGLAALGSRREILDRLAVMNTAPEREGDDVLYGPGICIQLPPGADPVTQMLLEIIEEEIAWRVIQRVITEMDWKIQDTVTGRELNA